jgi:hypothetical protein
MHCAKNCAKKTRVIAKLQGGAPAGNAADLRQFAGSGGARLRLPAQYLQRRSANDPSVPSQTAAFWL